MQYSLSSDINETSFQAKSHRDAGSLNAVYESAFVNLVSRALKRKHLTLCIFISVLILSGCSKHNQISTDIQDYAERLQSFTDIKIIAPPSSLNLMAPNKIALAQSIEQVSINLREFYAFKQCALNQLIAERNTALGKFQLPSSRFIYEIALIQEFERCRLLIQSDLATSTANEKKDKEQLIIKLDEWQKQKQRRLPKVWSNFITQSKEIYLSFTQAQDFIAAAPSDNFQSTRQALQFLSGTYNNAEFSANDLENHLKELENSRLPARMWRTQLSLSLHLDAISPLLETYLNLNQCKDRKQESDIAIMQNIFKIFFADKIQPLAAELNRYHYQLSPILLQLTADDKLPHEFTVYIREHIGEKHKAYKASMQRHIGLWQEIFARCG